MQFKKIELQDRNLFLKYLGEYKFWTYEYSFTTLYLWREYLKVEFAINDNYIAVRKFCNELGNGFMEPIGCREKNLKNIVTDLNEIKIKDNMDYLFVDVEESFLNKLIDLFGDKIEYREDKDNFDYVYNTNDLITLAGGKLKKRRTKYNVFVKEHVNLRLEYLHDNQKEDEIKNHCKKLAKDWYDNKAEKTDETYYELKGISELLDNIKFLNLKVIAVYCNDKLIGFSIGEIVNDDYALIHIEKCDKEYDGVYEYINKSFVSDCFSNTQFINRGEDCGDEGMRQAKRGYRPIKLEKKYIVNLKDI